MINLNEIVRRMTANAQAIRAMMESISDEQAQWKPNPDTWSMSKVMEHVYNEERTDFRKHLKEMFHDPPLPWEGWHPEEYVTIEDFRRSLEGFLTEREASLTWLKSLESPDWGVVSRASFGPNEILELSAGDVLFSWVAHDHLHMRQMNELLYAWNEAQASPCSVQYAGGW